MDEWDWHRVLDVNLTGAFLMTQSAGRVMRARGSGVILTLVTESARDGRASAAFLASMQGLAEFTRQAARELSPYGLRVHLLESHPENIVGNVLALLAQQTEES
jgi:3-oxoacyl-[acyl-carrier protein] reductase